MAEQDLHRSQVHALVQEVRGEAVPQAMVLVPALQARCGLHLGPRPTDMPRGDRPVGLAATPTGEEPAGAWTSSSPVPAQLSQQRLREHDHSVLLALARSDVQHAGLALDVFDPEPGHLADSQASTEPEHDEGLVAFVGRPCQAGQHLVLAHDDRQRLGPPRWLQRRDHSRPRQGYDEQEPNRGDEEVLGRASQSELVTEMPTVLPHVALSQTR